VKPKHALREAGVRLALTCNAVGVPARFTYHGWRQAWHGQVIRMWTSAQATSELIINHATYQDTGNYSCIVDNGILGQDGELQQMGKDGIVVVHGNVMDMCSLNCFYVLTDLI
jgi:hypothetical protein